MNASDGTARRLGNIIVTVVAIVVGLFTLADLFLSQTSGDALGLAELVSRVSAFLVGSTAIIVTFALLLGFVNVVTVHWSRIRTRQPDFIYSAVLLVSLVLTLAVGLTGPTSGGAQFIFAHILQPLESTFFALLALFMVTAAFRAFRINSFESFFFILFAIIVLLGQVPISIYLREEIPIIKDWIMTVPALAGVRGILLGVALGTIATGLRILIGAERPYTH